MNENPVRCGNGDVHDADGEISSGKMLMLPVLFCYCWCWCCLF